MVCKLGGSKYVLIRILLLVSLYGTSHSGASFVGTKFMTPEVNIMFANIKFF